MHHTVVLVMKAVVPMASPVPSIPALLNAFWSLKHIYSVNVCYVVQTVYDFVLINMWKDSYCFTVWKPITTCFEDRYAFILLVLLFKIFFL